VGSGFIGSPDWKGLAEVAGNLRRRRPCARWRRGGDPEQRRAPVLTFVAEGGLFFVFVNLFSTLMDPDSSTESETWRP
jgi:hypothetical protein